MNILPGTMGRQRKIGAIMPSPSRWRGAFGDPFAIEWEDVGQDPSEARYSLIGMVENRMLFMGYTIRNGKIRIVTARKAEPYERRRYHEENREA